MSIIAVILAAGTIANLISAMPTVPPADLERVGTIASNPCSLDSGPTEEAETVGNLCPATVPGSRQLAQQLAAVNDGVREAEDMALSLVQLMEDWIPDYSGSPQIMKQLQNLKTEITRFLRLPTLSDAALTETQRLELQAHLQVVIYFRYLETGDSAGAFGNYHEAMTALKDKLQNVLCAMRAILRCITRHQIEDLVHRYVQDHILEVPPNNQATQRIVSHIVMEHLNDTLQSLTVSDTLFQLTPESN